MANIPRRYDNLADFDFESLVAPQNANQQLDQNTASDLNNQIAQNQLLADEDQLALNQDVDNLNDQAYAVNPTYAEKARAAGERYLSQKKTERTTTAEILKKAQEALLARSQEGWTSGDWFRLSAALGKPTRTGNFGETLTNAAEVMASVSDRQTKAKQDYEALKLKYQLQNAAIPAEDSEQEFTTYTKLAGGRGQGASRLRQMQMERDALPKNDPARAELNAAIELMTTEKKTKANSPSGQFVDLVNIANDPNQPKEVREAAAAKIRKDTYIPPEKAPKGAPPPVIDLTGAENTGIRLGVPVLKDNPFSNVDQKTAQQLVLQASKRAQAEIAKVEEEADKAQFSQQKMERFLKLNKENPTGAVTGKLPSFRAAAQEMDNITAELAPQKRIAGSGSVSDFDAKQLLKAVVNPSNSYEANKNIGAAWDAYAKTIKEKSNFMRNYFTANKTLDGANQQWMRYMTANPIFDPKQPGTFAPNKARKTYKDYFYPQQQKSHGGRVGYAEGGAVDTAYADDYDPTLDVLASKYGAYTGGQVGLMDSPYGDVYHPEATDLSVLANKYAYGGSVKKNQYDEFGRQKLASGGKTVTFTPLQRIFSELGTTTGVPDWVKFDESKKASGPALLRWLRTPQTFQVPDEYLPKENNTSESGSSSTGNTDASYSVVGRKFNPYTGDPYNYENMSQHDFYGDSNAVQLTESDNQSKATSNKNVDVSNRTTDNPEWFDYLQNVVDATPRKYTNQAPQLDRLLSQDYLLNLDDNLFAKGGAVKHPQYDAQGRQKLAWGGNAAFSKTPLKILSYPNTNTTTTPVNSEVTTSLPLPVVVAATNLGRKYKAFTGNPYEYGYGGSHEFYVNDSSANSDTSSSDSTSSNTTSTGSTVEAPSNTATSGGWIRRPSNWVAPTHKWVRANQEGGAVHMQEGGTPPESVVRLKPIRSSDSANRARAFFGQGMGMSIGDEAEALYRRYLTDEGNSKSYGQLVDEIRSDYRRFSEENPEQQMIFELSGGIAPTVGAMMLPGGQVAAGANVGRMGALTKTPLRRAIVGGGTSGTVSGFNAGEDTLSNRLGSAAESGVTGAVLAPVVGKAGQLALRGGKGAINLAKRPFQIGDNYLEQQAMDKVLAKMRQDGITPRQAIGKVAQERGLYPTTQPVGTRPDTRLMDTSQGLTDLAETVTQRPGGGRTAMVEDMKNRVRGTKGKVTQMANEALAGNKAYFKEVTDLTNDLRSKANSAYQAAYAHGDVSDPRIMGILDTPEFKRAYQEVMKTNQIKKANAIARGEDPSQFDMKQIYRVKPGQNPDSPILDLELTDVPDVKTLDNIKQGIDTVIAKGFQSDDKISRDAANALKQLKNTYVGIIDDAVPAYKVARNQYKGDIEIIDALETGRNQYSKMLPDEARHYVSTLSDAEKQALRVGYAQNFATKIGEAKNSINAAEQIIGAENERLRLRALFNSDAEYKVFENALMAESRNFKNAGQIVANSATERRAMGRKEFENKDAVGEILDATRGGVTSTVLSILRKAPSLFRNEKIAEKVSHILSTGTPQEINGILKQLDKRAAGFAKAARRDERVGYAGAKGTGRAAGQTPVAASYEEPAPEQAPSAIDEGSQGALDPSESVVFDSPDIEMQDESVDAEQPEIVIPEQRYRGGSVRRFDSGGYAQLTEKEIADHAKMVEYQKARRKQADDYLKQVYDRRAKAQLRSPISGVGGGAAIGHMSDPSSVKSLIPNFAKGGHAVKKKALKNVIRKMAK